MLLLIAHPIIDRMQGTQGLTTHEELDIDRVRH